MKKVLLLFLIMTFVSCDKEEKGLKIIGSKELTMVVASEKLKGLIYDDGFPVICDVYAVKIGDVQKWSSYGYINDFEYENGYEYLIKIKVTDYEDTRGGGVSYRHHDLLEIISKEKKDSEGLPENFIPDGYPD